MSRIVDIADLITTYLNTEIEELDAKRVLYFHTTSIKANDLDVVVVPLGIESEEGDRCIDNMTYIIDVLVQRKTSDDEDIETLLTLCELIYLTLRNKNIENFMIENIENNPVFDFIQMKENKIFQGLLRLSVRAYE